MSICGMRSRISHFAASTFDLRLRHFGALFRDGQDAIDQADADELAGPGLVTQFLQLEVQFPLLFSDTGIGIVRNAKPQIARRLARREGWVCHELGLQRAEGSAALDPDFARPQAATQHGEGGDLPQTAVPLAIRGDDRLGDRLSQVGRGGCGDRCQKCRAPVLATSRMQPEMALRLGCVLAPGLASPAIFGQNCGLDANLIGDESDHGRGQQLFVLPTSTEVANEAKLNRQSELIVGCRLGLHQVQFCLSESGLSVICVQKVPLRKVFKINVLRTPFRSIPLI